MTGLLFRKVIALDAKICRHLFLNLLFSPVRLIQYDRQFYLQVRTTKPFENGCIFTAQKAIKSLQKATLIEFKYFCSF